MIFTNKIWIIGCTLAIIVGASLILPLLLFSVTETNAFPPHVDVFPNPQSNRSQIGANVIYASVELSTVKVKNGSNSTLDLQSMKTDLNVNATKYLNSNESIPDAEVDYFLIEIFSENGTSIGKIMDQVGTAYDRSFIPSMIDSFDLRWDKLFGIISSGGSNFYYTWSSGTSRVSEVSGDTSIKSATVHILENSQKLTMYITRIGSVTIRGNSTTVSTADRGLINQFELNKSGNAFVYGVKYNHSGSFF